MQYLWDKAHRTGYVHFFVYGDQELQCCDSCMPQAPAPIFRKEYWARGYGIYDEPDDGQPLWRYVDLPKFLDMILLKRLWLPRVATLDDAFEGALGAKTRHPERQKWLYDFSRGSREEPTTRVSRQHFGSICSSRANPIII